MPNKDTRIKPHVSDFVKKAPGVALIRGVIFAPEEISGDINYKHRDTLLICLSFDEFKLAQHAQPTPCFDRIGTKKA
ncbi:MAG TPA: hypothetical protein VG488_07540 [Candidatus Angelobacter sp.]|nr:hypothetical protein [Candidatus Angelobacter sp.]